MSITVITGWTRHTARTLSAATGLLCAIHCAALPVFTAALVAMGMHPSAGARWEAVLMISAVLLGLFGFAPIAARGENPFPLQAAFLALGFLLGGLWGDFLPPLMRQSLLLSASLLLLLAHLQNLWHGRRDRHHACRVPSQEWGASLQ